ncbi:PDZ domain-containing protein [Herbidospora sp. NEAU-GS84]|uniref:PDZ domain-containing protein n=1 Tax=Herbidospora solisilvae TaxID=2696284 RepID=A0A7C9N8V7_9ACTN|nr:trypsin-like peptidase domain-containing protein [Herbidospora solisilvae]NAS24373.1 PDZ domain-containing protein [Herbidospora solisilvae]
MEFSPVITRIAVLACLAAAAGCANSSPGTATATPSAAPTSTVPGAPVTPAQQALGLESLYEDVIHKVLPSIVQITTGNALGSGIVFDTQGHVVTNAHVVGDARDFEVTVPTGGAAREATLVSSFPAGDLAVIKVTDPRGLTPAVFGDSSKLRVGQIVLAMGNPLGFSGTVTTGIVSALGRTISGPREGGTPGATITNAVQTSAPINPGNSGGALVDLHGQVIGIPTLGANNPQQGPADGIGFAIPSATATDITRQIVQNGRVVNSRRAALGVQVGTAIGRNGEPMGVQVGAVTRNGPSEKAGIRTGDVITSVNGKATEDTTTLSEVLATLKPGQKVPVVVRRSDGSETTVQVTLGELPGGS